MGDKRMKYLDMLQSVISRMAGNQLTLRTWSVGLGTAVIGFAAAKDGHPTAALLALLPAAVFWILDAYYLALEREFRDLFNTARKVNDDDPDFSFNIPGSASNWIKALAAPAVWLVHLPVIALALGIGLCALSHASS
jgi:hypothetical protein